MQNKRNKDLDAAFCSTWVPHMMREGERKEKGSEKEQEGELTGHIWKESWIGRHYWNKQIGKLEGGTHTARKGAHVASSLCSFACGCVRSRHTHTSGCHNSSSSHKKKKQRERERERGRRLAVISTIQTTTQFSLSGHNQTHYSKMQTWIALLFNLSALPKHIKQVQSWFHKRCYFPVCDVTCDFVHLCCCSVSLMEWDESSTDAATAIYFICILLQPFGFDLTFCSGGCGRIHARSRPRALLKIDEREDTSD